MKGAIVWRDGRVQPASEAVVSVLDAGVLYGDGLFETMRADGAEVEWLDEHVDRMLRSATALSLALPPAAELVAGVRAAVAAGGFATASVRLTVTRGVVDSLGPRGAARSSRPSWWVMVSPVTTGPPEPVAAVLLDPALMPARPEHKSLSWQHAIVAQIEAGEREGIYVNAAGEVTESISSNLFAVFDGVLRTPPVDRGLPGVTRMAIIAEARRTGLIVEESPLPADRLPHAEEIMLSSAVSRLRPVVELDGKPVGDGRPGTTYSALLAALASH